MGTPNNNTGDRRQYYDNNNDVWGRGFTVKRENSCVDNDVDDVVDEDADVEDADADEMEAADGWDAGAAVAAELRWTRAPLPAPWVQSGQVSSIFLTAKRSEASKIR